MTPSIWCVFIVCNRIKNKCKEAYLYVTTVSNRFQNYLDPDCSSKTRVATDMKLFPDSDEIENRILTLAPFAVWNTKNNAILARTRFKEGLKLEFLKYFSGIWWWCTWIFFCDSTHLTLFDSKPTRQHFHEFFES